MILWRHLYLPCAILTATATPAARAQIAAPAQAPIAETGPAQAATHLIVVHVDTADPAIASEALGNVKNLLDYEHLKQQRARVEVVANGPGISMFNRNQSRVADQVSELHRLYPEIVFSACAISIRNQERAEGTPVVLMDEASVVPSGVVRLMELQEQHYTYVKP